MSTSNQYPIFSSDTTRGDGKEIIDPRELNDLAEFASLGGIGKGLALTDCVAQSPYQLMYCQNDQLILLRDLGEKLIASCEGVVGWIDRKSIKFDQEYLDLSSPDLGHDQSPTIVVPRTIVVAPSPPNTYKPLLPDLDPIADHEHLENNQLQQSKSTSDPQSTSTSTSTPTPIAITNDTKFKNSPLPSPNSTSITSYKKRISSPFELDSPTQSPGLDQEMMSKFPHAPSIHLTSGSSDEAHDVYQCSQKDFLDGLKSRPRETDFSSSSYGAMTNPIRDSVLSTTSSEGLGGIGGFMMGGSAEESLESESMEELRDDTSPANTSLETPFNSYPPSATDTHPPSMYSLHHSPPTSPVKQSSNQGDNADDAIPDASSEWDIYEDYARESMYVKRASQRRSAKVTSMVESDDGMAAFSLIKAAMETSPNQYKLTTKPLSPKEDIKSRRMGRPTGLDLSGSLPKYDETKTVIDSPDEEDDAETPKVSANLPQSPMTPGEPGFAGRSLATQLRLRIQRERENQPASENSSERQSTPSQIVVDSPLSSPLPAPPLPPRSASRPAPAPIKSPKTETPAFIVTNHTASPTLALSKDDEFIVAETVSSSVNVVKPENDVPTNTETTHPIHEGIFRSASPTEDGDRHEVSESPVAGKLSLASPIPLDEPKSTTQSSLYPSRQNVIRSQPDLNPISNKSSPGLEVCVNPPEDPSTLVPPPPNFTPMHSPLNSKASSPWSPSSPCSPHSITATRQAVEVARSTPDVHNAPGLTLVGRMDADLRGAKGPIPITFLIGGPGMPPIPPTLPSPVPSVDGHGRSAPVSQSPKFDSPQPKSPGIGSGHPNFRGRASPNESTGSGTRSTSSPTFLVDPVLNTPMSDSASRFPRQPTRSASTPIAQSHFSPAQSSPITLPPVPPAPVTPSTDVDKERQGRSKTVGASTTNGQPGRARSRSFSAAFAKAVGRGKKGKETDSDIDNLPPMPTARADQRQPTSPNDLNQFGGYVKESDIPKRPSPPPVLSIDTDVSARREEVRSPIRSPHPDQSSPITRHGPSTPIKAVHTPPAPSPQTSVTSPSRSVASTSTSLHKTLTDTSSESLSPPAQSGGSSRSTTFSFGSLGSRTPKKSTTSTSSGIQLPSPVSHKDYAEETVKADGMDFEIVQPKRPNLLSPSSDDGHSVSSDGHHGDRPGMTRSETLKSDLSGASSKSQSLPEIDEWGFLKDSSPTPEMFQSRNAAGEHRAAEGKWLGIISTPLPPQTAPPKKVRKLVLENGIPASLRGKVWAWFMSGTMSARRPGLYAQLLEHEREDMEGRIDRDVSRVYADHATFASPTSPGTSDLRSLLRAYSNFAPNGYHPELAHIAGMLLIHCVVEDAFWLLNGLVGNLMNTYFTEGGNGMRIDAAVFGGVLAGSEPRLGKKFRELGIHPMTFLPRWYKQLFLRCLPWPTALRVIDGVISEGPRFLLIASLSILTLSRERLIPLNSKDQILGYLHNLPQDALLLPETFMKACGEVRFRDEDWKRMRAVVEKEMGLVA